jgi:hypothetical protein
MIDAQPEKDQRLWIVRWVTDEAFWRSLVIQTTAGLIVLTVGALYVAASGYLEFWAVLRVAGGLLALVVAALVIVLPAVQMQGDIVRSLQRSKDRNRFGRVLTAWIIAAVLWAAIWIGFAIMVIFVLIAIAYVK